MRHTALAAAVYVGVIGTPLGNMVALVDNEGAVLGLEFADTGDRLAGMVGRAGSGVAPVRDDSRCADLARELGEYFGRTRREFGLLLRPLGTPFQQRVWRELRHIPYGRTITYDELARRLGSAKLVRAVGGANAANPIAVVIPCHRVVGADGGLVGYGGGLERKRALLELEGSRSRDFAAGQQSLPWE
jgi:methylated-DNA-[protein]-cysteine S-methyltransferase